MAINDKEIKRIIKVQETYEFHQNFPRELEIYLYDRYSEDPWPFELTPNDLYREIKADAHAYFMGKLVVTIKAPLEKASIEIQHLRELYGDAMCDIRDLQSYIDELHE